MTVRCIKGYESKVTVPTCIIVFTGSKYINHCYAFSGIISHWFKFFFLNDNFTNIKVINEANFGTLDL